MERIIPNSKLVINSFNTNNINIDNDLTDKPVVANIRQINTEEQLTKLVQDFITGNYSFVDMEDALNKLGIKLVKTFETNENFSVRFIYNSKVYLITCNSEAGDYGYDDLTVDVFTKDEIKEYVPESLINEYFDVVSNFGTTKYAFKNNSNFSSLKDLNTYLLNEYRNNLALINFLDDKNRTTNINSGLYKTTDNKTLNARNYIDYIDEIKSTIGDDVDEFKRQALKKLIKDFSEGNLAYAQVKLLLTAIGVENYSMANNSSKNNYILKFDFEGVSYKIVCNQKAGRKGSDDIQQELFSKEDLLQFEVSESILSKYFEAAVSINNTTLSYKLREGKTIEDFIKEVPNLYTQADINDMELSEEDINNCFTEVMGYYILKPRVAYCQKDNSASYFYSDLKSKGISDDLINEYFDIIQNNCMLKDGKTLEGFKVAVNCLTEDDYQSLLGVAKVYLEAINSDPKCLNSVLKTLYENMATSLNNEINVIMRQLQKRLGDLYDAETVYLVLSSVANTIYQNVTNSATSSVRERYEYQERKTYFLEDGGLITEDELKDSKNHYTNVYTGECEIRTNSDGINIVMYRNKNFITGEDTWSTLKGSPALVGEDNFVYKDYTIITRYAYASAGYNEESLLNKIQTSYNQNLNIIAEFKNEVWTNEKTILSIIQKTCPDVRSLAQYNDLINTLINYSDVTELTIEEFAEYLAYAIQNNLSEEINSVKTSATNTNSNSNNSLNEIFNQYLTSGHTTSSNIFGNINIEDFKAYLQENNISDIDDEQCQELFINYFKNLFEAIITYGDLNDFDKSSNPTLFKFREAFYSIDLELLFTSGISTDEEWGLSDSNLLETIANPFITAKGREDESLTSEMLQAVLDYLSAKGYDNSTTLQTVDTTTMNNIANAVAKNNSLCVANRKENLYNSIMENDSDLGKAVLDVIKKYRPEATNLEDYAEFVAYLILNIDELNESNIVNYVDCAIQGGILEYVEEFEATQEKHAELYTSWIENYLDNAENNGTEISTTSFLEYIQEEYKNTDEYNEELNEAREEWWNDHQSVVKYYVFDHSYTDVNGEKKAAWNPVYYTKEDFDKELNGESIINDEDKDSILSAQPKDSSPAGKYLPTLSNEQAMECLQIFFNYLDDLTGDDFSSEELAEKLNSGITLNELLNIDSDNTTRGLMDSYRKEKEKRDGHPIKYHAQEQLKQIFKKDILNCGIAICNFFTETVPNICQNISSCWEEIQTFDITDTSTWGNALKGIASIPLAITGAVVDWATSSFGTITKATKDITSVFGLVNPWKVSINNPATMWGQILLGGVSALYHNVFTSDDDWLKSAKKFGFNVDEMSDSEKQETINIMITMDYLSSILGIIPGSNVNEYKKLLSEILKNDTRSSKYLKDCQTLYKMFTSIDDLVSFVKDNGLYGLLKYCQKVGLSSLNILIADVIKKITKHHFNNNNSSSKATDAVEPNAQNQNGDNIDDDKNNLPTIEVVAGHVGDSDEDNSDDGYVDYTGTCQIPAYNTYYTTKEEMETFEITATFDSETDYNQNIERIRSYYSNYYFNLYASVTQVVSSAGSFNSSDKSCKIFISVGYTVQVENQVPWQEGDTYTTPDGTYLVYKNGSWKTLK